MHWADRIGRRLKLRDLHILLAVMQCGSMAKAAGQLSVSNPVVSKAVSDLEHTLGVRLLDRSAQGVEPTIYGRALLDHALSVFDDLRQAVKHVEFLADPTAGEARIGSSIAIASGLIAAVVDRLSRQHPRIVFHLLAAESSMTYRALEERKVDLVIARIFKPIADEQMDAEVLYDEQEVVVAGAQNPWTRRRKIELAELMREPWTLPPPDTLSGSVIAEAFRDKGLDLPTNHNHHVHRSGAQRAARHRTLSHDRSQFRIAVFRQQSGAQALARRVADDAKAGWDHHLEESHAQSGRTAFHRLRP